MNKTLNRIWDPEGRYVEGFLKEYTHWVLEVSYRQHTLGCYIIFAKRAVEQITELHDDEIIELKQVMVEIETTLKNIPELNPDRFNYMQLGNALPQLHFHGIPRYSSERTFNNKLWIDEAWGMPPKWNTANVSNKVVLPIRDIIIQKLP